MPCKQYVCLKVSKVTVTFLQRSKVYGVFCCFFCRNSRSRAWRPRKSARAPPPTPLHPTHHTAPLNHSAGTTTHLHSVSSGQQPVSACPSKPNNVINAKNLTVFTLCVFVKRLVRQFEFRAQYCLLLQQQFGHGWSRRRGRRRRRCSGTMGCLRTSTTCP